MDSPLFDTHAHLDDDRFQEDLPQVLTRAAAAGVQQVVTIGVDGATSRRNLELARRFPMLRAAVGIQPNHVAESLNDWPQIVELVTDPVVVAVGETGLDRYWDRTPFALQEEFFQRHLELARQVGKPLIIHCREAEADVIRMLEADYQRHGPVSGILHSYTGDLPHAERGLACGLHVSFAGMITYKTAAKIREVARSIPLNRLLIETDSPYLAPVPHRGQRNEPAFVTHTAAAIAQLHGVSLNELVQITTENARRLFQWA